MQVLRTGLSCFVLAAGVAAFMVWLSNNAAAARGCPATMNPVCATKPDGPHVYDNACQAKADGARVVHLGACQQILCMGMWPKVAMYLHVIPTQQICGIDPLTHAMMTYPNYCGAEAAGATWLYNGPCRGGRRH